MKNGGSIRKGRVSKLDTINKKVDVLFDDDNHVIKDIKLLDIFNQPDITQKVICLFTIDEEGICLNTSYYENNFLEGYTHYKQLSPNALIGTNESTGDMILIAPSIKLIGDIMIEGNVTVNGNIHATGAISAEGGTP